MWSCKCSSAPFRMNPFDVVAAVLTDQVRGVKWAQKHWVVHREVMKVGSTTREKSYHWRKYFGRETTFFGKFGKKWDIITSFLSFTLLSLVSGEVRGSTSALALSIVFLILWESCNSKILSRFILQSSRTVSVWSTLPSWIEPSFPPKITTEDCSKAIRAAKIIPLVRPLLNVPHHVLLVNMRVVMLRHRWGEGETRMVVMWNYLYGNLKEKKKKTMTVMVSLWQEFDDVTIIFFTNKV